MAEILTARAKKKKKTVDIGGDVCPIMLKSPKKVWSLTYCSPLTAMVPALRRDPLGASLSGLMTKQDQADKSIPAYMNGNGAPRTGNWFYWW